MISLHFTTRLPGFTLEADCDLPGDGFTAVLGPSSCGKSTLAGSIADLVKPASGTISVNGRVFRSDDPCIDLPVESRGIGFVFQSHRLFPHLTVRKNLLFGRRLGGRRTAVDQERLIEVLGIAHLLSRRPDTLSGEVGITMMLGGNISERTNTLSLEIFNAVSHADFDAANALCLLLSLFAAVIFLAAELLIRRSPRL